MSFYDDDDVASWGSIEQDDEDLDAMARLYIYDTVTKHIDIAGESGDIIPNSFADWQDIFDEELAFDHEQGEWLTDDIFERFCGRVDVLLPFFLENYEPIKDIINWD